MLESKGYFWLFLWALCVMSQISDWFVVLQSSGCDNSCQNHAFLENNSNISLMMWSFQYSVCFYYRQGLNLTLEHKTSGFSLGPVDWASGLGQWTGPVDLWSDKSGGLVVFQLINDMYLNVISWFLNRNTMLKCWLFVLKSQFQSSE